jgi:ketosteroid isomerase-like protein
MKRSLCVIAAGVALFSPLSLRAQQSGSAPQMQTSGPLVDSLRVLIVQMGSDFHSLDMSRVIAMYGDSSIYVHIFNGDIRNRAGTEDGLRLMTRSGMPTSPVTFRGNPRVIVLDQNVAIVYDSLRVDPPLKAPSQIGLWTGVLRRGPDGWKIVHSHGSVHQENSATHPRTEKL